jgi:hypothetical protein
MERREGERERGREEREEKREMLMMEIGCKNSSN